jgi:hypothetical protein
MTITQNVASKLVVGFVAVSMLFTLSFAPAQAATAAELEAQIEALLAQIESLQGSTGGSCASFTMDLTMGASGAEVTALQNFLMGEGHSIAAGATGYFGAQTQAALAAYQSANGISPAAGYFGPITRAKVNSECSSDDDANDDDANDDDDSGELSGEASLDTVDMKDGEDTDIEEGQEDAPVADMDVEFTDGDGRITRIDLALVSTDASGEMDPWDTFEDISLWVDGEEVARESADDEDAYLDEDDGSIRLSGLDIVAEEDEEMTITIAVTPQSGVDDLPRGWRVDVDAIRYEDGDDVTSTDTTTGDLGANGIDFDIEEEGGEDELVVRSSSEDPDATTLELDDSDRSDWITIFAYRLDTDDSTNDITVNELPVAITMSSSSASTYVNDMQLVIDGETYDDYATGTASERQVYTFDTDGDLVIEAGEEVTVEVQVEFNALELGSEGVTIYATSSASGYDAEGADDLESSQLEGSATGETHTLRTSGVTLSAGDSTEEEEINSDTDTTDDEGVFTLEFDVTAFDEDIYVNKTAGYSSSTSAGTSGVHYVITDGSGTQTGTTTPSGSLSSTADSEGSQYVVREGETETFTLTVVYNPGTSGFYGVQLFSFNFNDAASNPDTYQRALPAADYETDALNI